MRLSLLLLVGCGRIGFDTASSPLSDGGSEGGTGDAGRDAIPDAADDELEMMFGAAAVTYLSFNGGPTLNFGATDNLRVEADKDDTAVIRFDVSAIPPTATITLVDLALWIEVGAVSSIAVHPVLEPWVEGTQDGLAGAASFNDRLPGVAWTAGGAHSPSSGAQVSSFPGALAGPIGFGLPPSLIQQWVEDPTINHGLVMFSNSASTVRMSSKETNIPSQRPRLLVRYRP